ARSAELPVAVGLFSSLEALRRGGSGGRASLVTTAPPTPARSAASSSNPRCLPLPASADCTRPSASAAARPRTTARAAPPPAAAPPPLRARRNQRLRHGRIRGALGEQGREQHGRQCDAAPGQTAAEQFTGPLQVAAAGDLAAAELPGGLVLGEPFEVTEHQR